MKEATGEVSMTVIVIEAVAVIVGILAVMCPKLRGTLEKGWQITGKEACDSGEGTWTCDKTGCSCKTK